MLKKEMAELLNQQLNLEFHSSNLYLQMAAWCDDNGFPGSAKFLEIHAEEEMTHMKRFFNYIRESGTMPIIGQVDAAKHEFSSLKEVFEDTLAHERIITESINKIAKLAFESSDMQTFGFMQYFLNEQHEEESTFSGIIDRMNVLGDDGKAQFMFDESMAKEASTKKVEPIKK